MDIRNINSKIDIYVQNTIKGDLMEINNKKFQQGDVIFMELTEKEKEEFRKGVDCNDKNTWNYLQEERNIDGKVTVAFGEATGHHHTFDQKHDERHVIGYSWANRGGRRGETNQLEYVELTSPATIKHQEHNPITVEPGIYKVKIVREFDHIGGITRTVVD